jgi:hypothetical protein
MGRQGKARRAPAGLATFGFGEGFGALPLLDSKKGNIMTTTKAKQKQWEWAEGFRPGKAEANAIGRMIDRLARDGQVSASRFVDEAKDPRSPAHELIDWNKNRAARRWQEHQARSIIHCCRLVYEDQQGDKKMCAAYLCVTTEDGRGYLPVETVMTNSDLREQALNEARRLLKGVRLRISHLDEFAAVIEAIDAVVEE